MPAPSTPPRFSFVLATCDAAAIVVFVTIGLISHHQGLSLGGYARDVLPLGAGWFGAALLLGAYRRPGAGPLVATWAVGVPAGVLVRALVLGHSLDGREAVFLGVCLATIGALVLAIRAGLLLARTPLASPARRRPLTARPDRGAD